MWFYYEGLVSPLVDQVTHEFFESEHLLNYDGTLLFQAECNESWGEDDENQYISLSAALPSCSLDAKRFVSEAAELGLPIDSMRIRRFRATHYDTVDTPMSLMPLADFNALPAGVEYHPGSSEPFPVASHNVETIGLRELTLNEIPMLTRGTGHFEDDGLRLDSLASLSNSIAAELIRQCRQRTYLVLDGIEFLSEAAAESLATFPGSLYLNGLSTVSDEVAAALSKHRGGLYLNGLRTLTDVGAESLGKVSHLSLNGLAVLTDAQAAALSQCGRFLSLDGLAGLSDTQAATLSQCKADLSLAGLARLTFAPLAKALAKQKHLRIENLSLVSNEAAQELSKHKGSPCLVLDRLETLSNEAAASLAKLKGERLSLDGIVTLPDNVAEALCRCRCRLLRLNGLKSLDEATAKALARFKGNLHLNGLSVLSPEAAAALATKSKGWLSLDGVADLTEAVAESLAPCKCDLSLEGLASVSPAAAALLARTRGNLDLSGLTEVSAEVAEAFRKKERGEIILPHGC